MNDLFEQVYRGSTTGDANYKSCEVGNSASEQEYEPGTECETAYDRHAPELSYPNERLHHLGVSHRVQPLQYLLVKRNYCVHEKSASTYGV